MFELCFTVVFELWSKKTSVFIAKLSRTKFALTIQAPGEFRAKFIGNYNVFRTGRFRRFWVTPNSGERNLSLEVGSGGRERRSGAEVGSGGREQEVGSGREVAGDSWCPNRNRKH